MADPADKPEGTPYRDPETAPFVYFDVAPTYGVYSGAIQIELASHILTPTAHGGVRTGFVTTGRLRCSPAAARHLRNAIDEALKFITQAQQSSVAAASKLN